MKKNNIIFWVATVVIVLWEGVIPLITLLFAPQYVNAATQRLGYPDYFAYALVICKILGTIAISYPTLSGKIKEWAYAGLVTTLVFAFLSHAIVDQKIGFMLLPLVVLGILAISYIYKNKLALNALHKKSAI